MKKALIHTLLPAVALAATWLPSAGAASTSEASTVSRTFDLESAISYALGHNLAIEQAQEQIKQQEGVILEVTAQAMPNVAVGADYSRIGEGLTNLNTSDRDWGIQVRASQLLYSGGNVSAARKSARLLRSAAALELESVINNQLLAVRSKFYAALLARQKIAVQEENIELLEEQLKDAEDRLEAGAISNFEVLRARVALANGQPPLITARNDYRISLEELRRVMGLTESPARDADSGLTITGSLSNLHRADYSLAAALESARANRPELKRLEKLMDARRQGVTVARSGRMPEVSLFGQYEWDKGGSMNGWDNRLEGWRAGVQASWAIFDGRATAGKVAQAKSQLEQGRIALEDARLTVDVEVRRAYSSLTEADQLLNASVQTVDQAQEALRLANVRYDAGSATQLDVQTSQVELTRARLNQLQASYSYKVALATLRQAMGVADPFIR